MNELKHVLQKYGLGLTFYLRLRQQVFTKILKAKCKNGMKEARNCLEEAIIRKSMYNNVT